MDRNMALEAVRVTEWAALASARWMGRGDEKAADQAAVDGMRKALNSLAISGT
ncbi:MAG: fructose-bisphosphatase class II, partial [Holosporales bacterium]